MIDDSDKQKIKKLNDIVEVIGACITLQGKGFVFTALCPFHDGGLPVFQVDRKRQRYTCSVCGRFGDVIQFVQEFDKVNLSEALELLARHAGI